MTSSETPTDESGTELPTAVAHERTPEVEPVRARDRDQLMRLAVLGVAIASGWGFILWTHNLRFTAPVAFLWIGWFAVVAGVHYLWRTGTATADATDEDAAWWRPAGAREELDREKRSLLKAIKEVEFDQQTGKMSEKDAQALTRMYRARAIEVIKALDELAAGGTRSVRQQIERELQVRLALDVQAKRGGAAADRKKRRAKAAEAPAKKPAAPAPAPAPAPKAEAKPEPEAVPEEPKPVESSEAT